MQNIDDDEVGGSCAVGRCTPYSGPFSSAGTLPDISTLTVRV
jgi:hypothetical protein